MITKKFIIKSCKSALKEDFNPLGDITSNLLQNNIKKKAKLISAQNGIIGGLKFANQTFKLIDKKIKFKEKKREGSYIKKGEVIAIIEGNIKNIIKGERVALNFLTHISGIATKTNQYVKKVKKKCKICCTRKTIPNLRSIQKYAVKLGGGLNHRFNLSDEYLIKDNHIAVSKIKNLVRKAAKSKYKKKITVEVENLKQLKEILGMNFHCVLFDNMSLKNLKKGVKIAKKLYETEASGNINIKNIRKISLSGVDRISIGDLTHSLKALDLKIEI